MDPAVRLVPFTAAHLDDFAALAQDADVRRYTRFPDPPQRSFPRTWLARYEEGRRDGTREAFAIEVANVASTRVAERCGYVLEGVRRKAYVKPGLRGDTAVYARLR
jgi:RimJ/RimL family protein N-acetyltransferase